MNSFLHFTKHLLEGLTIPRNDSDKVEVELYKNLDKSFVHSDRIIRWYRNAKKQGVDERELKKIFVDNLKNIKDLFITYETYVERLKKNKMLNRKIKVDAGNKKIDLDPVKDIDKIRRLEGFQLFVNAMGDKLLSGTTIDTTKQKFAITDEDRKKIRLVGFTKSVMCWCTEGYETTNKFVYQLWQNDKTLGRGGVYGNPTNQTPYCTHSLEHWESYSEGYDPYQQFWFLNRIDDRMNVVCDVFKQENDNAYELLKNIHMEKGDLTNENVVYVFKLMKGLGSVLLIAMNDSGQDLLDRNDESVRNVSELEHGGEIQKLSDELFSVGSQNRITVGGVDVFLKKSGVLMLKSDPKKGYTGGGIAIDGDDDNNQKIISLNGCPQEVTGSFTICRLSNVHSLEGCPKSVVGSFFVRDVPLESLVGCPEVKPKPSVDKNISISRTGIKNLVGVDPNYDGELEIYDNPELASLEGIPKNCKLVLEDDNIESLKGMPGEMVKGIYLDLPNLKSLDYAPRICGEFSMEPNDHISKEAIDDYKKYRECDLTNNHFIDDEEMKEKLQIWHDIHTMPDGEHYRQSGPTQAKALEVSLDDLKKMAEESKNVASESTIDEVQTSQTEAYKFEVEIANNIEMFIKSQTNNDFKTLNVHHYEDSDSKYHSDIYIENTLNGKRVWIEAKKNKYANLGSSSFKYDDGKWSCTTLSEGDPLGELYLQILNEHAERFISFCKEHLGKEDISIPKDITEDLVEAWKNSGNIRDTENDVQFITDKVPIDDFGEKISEFYKNAKEEPVYYMQVDDSLYIVDPKYNPLGLKTFDGKDLMPLSDAYRIGRIQFRLKGQKHTSVSGEEVQYYSVFLDVKILADKDNDVSGYQCSFLSPEKFPIVDEKIKDSKKDIGGDASDLNIDGKKIWIDDIRPAPEGFVWFKTVNDFIDYAHENGVDDVSLFDTDHDAGECKEFGGDYAVCFEYLERCGVKNVLVHIHSSNPIGANNIRRIIARNRENGWREVRNSN